MERLETKESSSLVAPGFAAIFSSLQYLGLRSKLKKFETEYDRQKRGEEESDSKWRKNFSAFFWSEI